MIKDDNNFQSQKLSFFKVVLLVNIAMIFYTIVDTLTKDLLERRGSGLFDNLFLRNTIILVILYAQIRMKKKPMCSEISQS